MPSTDPTSRPPSFRPVRALPRFAIVMAALVAVATFPQSALFTLEHVDLRGAQTLSPEAVLLVAGIRRGDRLFAVDVAAALRRLRADPRVQTADLWLRPPRTVVIHLVERRALVALVAGERYALLGEDLVVVAMAETPGALPEVVDVLSPSPWARPGAPVASDGARAAVAVLPAIPEALRSQVRRLVVSAGHDLTVVLRSGLEIRVGTPAGADERLAQVPGILAALRARGIAASALDLRYTGSIAVRLATGGEAR